jgi:hypothetical protein
MGIYYCTLTHTHEKTRTKPTDPCYALETHMAHPEPPVLNATQGLIHTSRMHPELVHSMPLVLIWPIPSLDPELQA